MNGRERLPRERMRPSRMCRSSSRVITFRARGALLPLFTFRPTDRRAPRGFYLAITRLSFSAILPLRHWCEVLQILTIATKISHCGLRSDDLSTNRLSAGALAANGCALVTPGDGASCAIS